MFGEGFAAYLVANPGIAALLGSKSSRSDGTTGVFPELAPDGSAFPWIAYMQVSGVQAESMQGMNALATVRYRISCTGSSYGQAKILAGAIRAAFGTTTQYQGELSDGSVLENARQVLETDDFETLPHGKIFTSHLDFEFIYLDSGDQD